MSDSLKIRNTGVSVPDILELIAQGRGYDSILNTYPQLRFHDIGRAAATARDIVIRHTIVCRSPDGVSMAPGAKLEMSRENDRWTESENRELRQLYRSGATPPELARIFLRSEPEIVKRILKLRITP